MCKKISDKSVNSHLLVAGNGMEALDILEKCSELPDIIFMDVNMPIMNGIECLQEIKKKDTFSSIHVVMISTAFDERIETEAKALGAYAFNAKPVSFDALADLIDKPLKVFQAIRKIP